MTCIEIPLKVKIGDGLVIQHGFGIVIHAETVIGRHCTLRQGVTIGNKIDAQGCVSAAPIIGDHVEFGAHSMVIGPVQIGHHVKIGAGAVVTKDLADYSVVVSGGFRLLTVLKPKS